MTLAWMAYALAVGTLLSVAAWASERVLRSVGRQGRWAWVAAGLGTLLVPAAALSGVGPDVVALVDGLLPLGSGGSAAVELPAATVVTEAAGRPVEGGWSWSFLPVLSRAVELGILGVWLAASAFLLSLYGFTWRRLRRRVERWPAAEMEGAPVRLTRSTGPAVVGVLRPVMMVPEWVRDLPTDQRALVLRHEREHLKAGDSRLLALFPLLTALVPWNLPLWWQLRRLRLAVELDCDARVLAGGGEPVEYGRLLVSMTRGPEGRATSEALPLTTAALLERRTDLERRIRTMTNPRSSSPVLHSIALTALASLALFVACDTPAPVESDPGSESDAAAAGAPGGTGAAGSAASGAQRIEELPPPPMGGSASDRPAFIPRDVDPKLANVDAVREALSRLYPEEARRQGLGGRTVLWLYVGAEGRVEKVHIQNSSEHPSLDRAAMQVAAEMTFEPARQDGEPIGVWVSQPVNFRLAATETRGTVRIRPDTVRYSEQEADTVGSGAMLLRGVTSLDASEPSPRPLVIVDGVVQGDDASLSELNALDIEKIEVVKGGAARELYGERAADGVVQITTKDAKRGG